RAVDLFRVQLQSRGIALIIDVPAGLGVIANRNQFEQVTINLVSNARDSVIDKADSNGDGAPKEIRIQAAQDQSWVSIEVRDTGSGIEPRLQRDLFEPFVTTKQDHGGSGLGLFICQDLAERMGGELVLLESSQAGTAFRLRLRAASAAP
ncbi:MAG: HAMP domain-containing sensor histidine kinase, partial [bacterium]